jgi:hypothetical protein
LAELSLNVFGNGTSGVPRVTESPRHRFSERLLAATNAEIASEKAASLGRAGRRLKEALTSLREPSTGPDALTLYLERLDEAAEALYFYIVQREACGLLDAAEVTREYDVPRDVQLRMGMRGRSR